MGRTKGMPVGHVAIERHNRAARALADQGGIVVVKRYGRRDSVVTLESVNPEGQTFRIKLKAEPGRLIWMYPVLRAEIDLRARRRARHSAKGRG